MIAHDSRQKFENKDYRDTYMAGRVRTSIALQIRALREQRQLSQAEFSDRVGKPQSVVSRLENTEYGRVTVQTLLDIASALDIALVVRFCTFDNFFVQMSDVSDRALSVESFSGEELERDLTHPLDATLQSSSQTSLSGALVTQMTGRAGQLQTTAALDFYEQKGSLALRAITTSHGMRNAA